MPAEFWNKWANSPSEGYELAHFCGELTRFVRDLMIARSCGAESTLLQVPSDSGSEIGELAGRFSEEDLSRFFNILLRAESEMRYALVPRFHLELALMKLVHARRLASLETLLSGLGGAGTVPGESLRPPRPAPAPPVRAFTGRRPVFAPPERQRRVRPGAEQNRSPGAPRRPRVSIAARAAPPVAQSAGRSGGDGRVCR